MKKSWSETLWNEEMVRDNECEIVWRHIRGNEGDSRRDIME